MINHVLVVEDEPLLRNLIASHLSLNGFRVSEARDGNECMNALKNSVPDLMLLDLNMPGMNGIKVLRTLQDLHINCPVILVTASEDGEALSEAKTLGIRDVFAKPFSLSAITLGVRRHLDPITKIL